MVETYKYKSKAATAIGAVATIISILGVDQLQAMFPGFGQYIPAIVALATWYLSQTTEDTRVVIAEQKVREEYEDTDNDIIIDPTVNIDSEEEDTVGDTDGC